MQIERRAVKTVAAGFGDRIDHAAGRAAKLGRIARGHNLKFLYGFLRNGVSVIGAFAASDPAEKGLIVVRAVNLYVRVDAALTGERNLPPRGVVYDCRRCEDDEVLKAPAVDR